jgi:hypothetical protein
MSHDTGSNETVPESEARDRILSGIKSQTTTMVARRVERQAAQVVDGIIALNGARTDNEKRLILEALGMTVGDMMVDAARIIPWETAPKPVRSYAETIAQNTGVDVETVAQSQAFRDYWARMTER